MAFVQARARERRPARSPGSGTELPAWRRSAALSTRHRPARRHSPTTARSARRPAARSCTEMMPAISEARAPNMHAGQHVAAHFVGAEPVQGRRRLANGAPIGLGSRRRGAIRSAQRSPARRKTPRRPASPALPPRRLNSRRQARRTGPRRSPFSSADVDRFVAVILPQPRFDQRHRATSASEIEHDIGGGGHKGPRPGLSRNRG